MTPVTLPRAALLGAAAGIALPAALFTAVFAYGAGKHLWGKR